MAATKYEEKVRNNRILKIDDAIRSGTYPNIASLAAKTEVNPRTIQRDIDYLRIMYNAPLEYDQIRKGYYYTEPNFFIKSIVLTEGELFSITLFDRLLEQYRNTPLEENLRIIFKKIVQSMPGKITIQTNFLSSRTSFITDRGPDIQVEVFTTIFSALQSNQTIRFGYRSVSRTDYQPRILEPYHAVYQRGSWYVIGHCGQHKEPTIFSFARMRNVTMTGKTFAYPQDFNPHDYFDEEIGIWITGKPPCEVELLYDSEAFTHALEQFWNNTQKVTQNKDGTVHVRFTTNQLPEVLYRVLSWGGAVKVLSPPELIEQVKAEIAKMEKKYGHGR
ncbi:hypothetical protein FACS189447_06490 [Spirochaetia bacterium]|nr:hypothetical protein FACS189447_06490 [Spirochaetia bacterium]